RAGELGVDQALTFLREVDAINNRRRTRMVDLALAECDGSVTGKNVTVWGASFKPGTDDIRDSPALAVAQHLARIAAHVTVHAPKALANARKTYPSLAYAEDPAEAASGADLVLHLTEWPVYGQLDPQALAAQVRTARIIDGRGSLDPIRWREAGWTYRS